MTEPKKNILIVEDEREYAEMVKLWLELAGYDCAIAETTQTGVSEMKARDYDLMILDLMLPGGGGFVLLHALQKDRAKGVVPVVILTGKPITPEITALIGKFSVSALFSKPYDPEKFLDVVDSLVNPQSPEGKA
jgi:two-component system, OmpR family, phosphate regulon response regulator PhoB